MRLGVCYFPEHWPSEEWERDVEAMADAGLEYVRMAEFSWGVLEPERGEFNFEWLDEAIELIGDHGMQVVLCTPTATPPKWLVDERPSIRQEEPDGTVREHGSRRHYCFNSEAYREETTRIVERVTERYANSPHVAGWQTDNEFGCHRTIRCYCDDCADAFRMWLADRYDDVDQLNEAWGNRFWSQQYSSFEEVDPPGPTPAEHHPSRLLAYARFSSDSVVDYNRLHADLIRDANPDWFVTHNFMGRFPTLNAYDVSDDLDLVSWDSYPTGFVQDRFADEASPDQLRAGDPDQVGMDHDLYRSALDRPFWVMEQQPGDVNWPPHCPQPGEGAMRLWAHHAAAHGADAVLYFRWRRCLEGQEQYHAGLRKADGSPDRGYTDATQTSGEFDTLGETDHVDAPVAVVFDYDSLWALDAQPHAPDFDYWALQEAFYRAVRGHGVQVDVVPPTANLSGYEAVVAPALHLVTDSLSERLTDYATAGGELLFGPRTGVKDAENKLRPASQPGPLADLVGATVDQHESLPRRLEAAVRPVDESDVDDDSIIPFRTWAEWLDPDAAETQYEYDMDGPADGRSAVVTNAVGDGHVTYCGVWPESALAETLAADLLDRAGVRRAERLPNGVRIGYRGGHTWVTNFTGDHLRLPGIDAESLVVDDTDRDAIDIGAAGGEIDADAHCVVVGPYGVAVVEGDHVDGLQVAEQ
ncbi:MULTISPECIES: beta-galactosidase Bga [Halorubrum]|uniref:beta-galactosidase n=1 Tax=Halorubrum tropicale TaxID=1765655 RepID=A0A0M9AKH9_9EURY|nr:MULTISPECIES: beta-galactosidase Bga [Halorubrum]KOX93308.1 beta-galactosidase [Halorubrum tropicale]TKX42831.1 beta-galactosidase [Halorubrum sp. ARQ200]TKX59871.1 beta-galactosidase [Halorubrum sp. ASP1]